MALGKKGLGRGLDALLDPYIEENKESSSSGIMEVDINSIDTNKEQPRKNFDEDSLNELAASIRVHGIVQPLLVKEKNGRYSIVAGERRYRAARIAKLKTVPVIPVDYDEAKMQEVALIENIQREDLNPIEEAAAIKFLMVQHDLTQEEISDQIGKSRPAVANSLRLLQLPETVTKLLENGSISAGHGRAIAGVTGKELQEKLAEETVRLGYSVRALESRIQNMSGKKPAKKSSKKSELSADMRELEKQFMRKTGSKLSISGNEKKGKIVIEYNSKDELQNIYDLFNIE